MPGAVPPAPVQADPARPCENRRQASIARAGLAAVHATFELARDGVARSLSDAIAEPPARPLGTRIVAGDAAPADGLRTLSRVLAGVAAAPGLVRVLGFSLRWGVPAVAKLVARFNAAVLAALTTLPGGRPPLRYGAAEAAQVLREAGRSADGARGRART